MTRWTKPRRRNFTRRLMRIDDGLSLVFDWDDEYRRWRPRRAFPFKQWPMRALSRLCVRCVDNVFKSFYAPARLHKLDRAAARFFGSPLYARRRA